jgi:bromodomain-containing protein 7/9
MYPDYLGIVGGEDKMMDLGTMQNKLDTGEYRGIEAFEVGLSGWRVLG